MLKNITSLILYLFLFSCSDLQDAAKSIDKVNENQDLIINKLNAIDKKIASLEKKVAQGAAANKPNKKNDKPKADPNKVYDIAEAGSIIVSEDTFALVNNFFTFKKPKNVKIKGFLRDIKCYELKKEDTSKEDMFSLSGKGFQIDINKKIIKKDALDEIKNKLSSIMDGDTG